MLRSCGCAAYVFASALLGCQAGATNDALVEFGPSLRLGKWQAVAAAGGTGDGEKAANAQDAADPDAEAAGSPANAPKDATTAGGRAGAGSMTQASASAGRGAAGSGTAGAKAAAGAPAAGSGGAMNSDGPVSVLAFDVQTKAQGGRYAPRNIGAIWIQNDAGQLVKTLKLWSRIRQRYLSKYNAARSGMTIDVTTSATLSSHMLHHVAWDLKDRSGQSAAPGKYTLFIEVTDKDAPGALEQLEFDTSHGAQTVEPDDANYYVMQKLVLR
jgi:hypothetical protein